MRTLVLLIAFSLAAFGQRHKLDEVDAEKPEGKLLQQVMQESDDAKKTVAQVGPTHFIGSAVFRLPSSPA